MRLSKTILFILLFWNQTAAAQISISEIMYDVSGSDAGREWVEITNGGSGSVTIATSTWKFFEAETNHSLSLFQGSVVIPSGGFAVIADNPAKFLTDWPNFSGTIFDSVFSLGNAGELIAIKSDTGTVVDELTYTSDAGGTGDGNSLQKINGVWAALTPTPGAANQNSQGPADGQGANPPVATTTSDTNPNDDSSSSSPEGVKTNWPIEPQIISRIVSPSVAIAGADIIFRGEAVGLDKKPLKNIRYLWNFGDGATKEGESVMHAYNFPAEYVVILEASSGHYEGSSRVRVKVVPADIVINSVVAGFDGKIELLNSSTQELDLSWWRIKSGNQFFTLPKNTKILPSGRLPVSAAVMGFPIVDMEVALLYPNGSLAYQYVRNVSEIAAVRLPDSAAEIQDALTVPAPEISPNSTAEADLSNQAVAVALAVSARDETGVQDAGASDNDTKSSSSLWLYGTGGVILLGLAFVLFPRPTPVRNPVDEFKIIED